MFNSIKSLLKRDNSRFIKIDSIEKTSDSIKVNFSFCEEISKYFRQNFQKIQYLKLNHDLTNIPDGIAIIPFVSNVLPIIWFFDLKLIIDEIDKNFFESIDDIKKGYKLLFPFIDFKGEVICKNTKDFSYTAQNNSVAMFSQGLDSINTVINNLDKNLSLLTLHGSDIPLDKTEGWNNLSGIIDEFAESVNVKNYYAKSNFRRMLNNTQLNNALPDGMKKSWWHQFQHGIGIISHATIIAYLLKSKNILIASSLSKASAKFENLKYNPIESSPIIDNNFKFAACRTIHDGYEFERIDKLRNTVSYSRENEPIFLRVCFTSQNGDNCSVCDKCSRSILGLISENENPNGYGFDVCDETLLGIRANLDDLKNGVEKKGWYFRNFRPYFWIDLQNNFQKNAEKYDFDENVKWILDYDFSNIKK